MRRPIYVRAGQSAFTLVELLVVIGIIAVLMGVLLPVMGRARQVSLRTKCLANIRSLCNAQAIYAATYKNLLVAADDGSYNIQGSWIGLLEGASTVHLARQCPADDSKYFTTPLPGPMTPPLYRMTSYAINNYISPTHAPADMTPIKKITSVRLTSKVIQFVELAGTGAYAGSDHIHVQDFYFAMAPQLTVGLIGKQMPVGLHGGKSQDWKAQLNYGFLDGHAETMQLQDVYTDPQKNLFDPSVAQ